MPEPPLRYENNISLDLSDLSRRMHQTEEQREKAYDLSRQIQAALVKASLGVGKQPSADNGDPMAPLRELVRSSPELLGTAATSQQAYSRLANLSTRIEGMVRIEAYHYFIQTGRLIPFSKLEPIYHCTDEEYLAGACMGLVQELQRYGLGRATVRDVSSVQQATNLVTALQDYLLQLDFRNGPLRRKFDGTKYCLKALETLLYELAVTSTTTTSGAEPANKKIKSSEPAVAADDTTTNSLIPTDELHALKERMDHRDQLRETLIKSCRDGQKAAKQAIFALHRQQQQDGVARARTLMKTCHDVIQSKLVPIVAKDPSLRTSGSYTSVLEEYVEARLFAAWLYGKADWLVEDDNGDDADDDKKSKPAALLNSPPAGILLEPQDFGEVSLEPDEYLGGLCDLTGEVGRYAVQRGTARDVPAVQLCLQTNMAVYSAMQSAERLSSPLHKKMDALRRSVEKIERMLYELSLSQAAGGRNVKTHMDIIIGDHHQGNKGEDNDV